MLPVHGCVCWSLYCMIFCSFLFCFVGVQISFLIYVFIYVYWYPKQFPYYMTFISEAVIRSRKYNDQKKKDKNSNNLQNTTEETTEYPPWTAQITRGELGCSETAGNSCSIPRGTVKLDERHIIGKLLWIPVYVNEYIYQKWNLICVTDDYVLLSSFMFYQYGCFESFPFREKKKFRPPDHVIPMEWISTLI
jgi:hypothetical protein